MNTINDTTNPDDRFERSGIVARNTGELYHLLSDGETIVCRLSPSLRKEFETTRSGRVRDVRRLSGSPAVVGERVRFRDHPDGGWITEILPRSNWLSRRSAVPMPGALPEEQVIAANVDLVMPVFAAASPPPKWNMLDRYLAAAGAAGIPAMVCITKLDLAGEGAAPELMEAVSEYNRIGCPTLLTSAVSGRGLAELGDALRGRTTVLLGKSGVGKTSLLNALEPGLGARVGEISRFSGKGRHTTSASVLFPLSGGGALVDTPGVREFGLWDVTADELIEYFPEMRPFAGKCRFGLGCSHDEEPGCAVRQAVMAGQISPRRYASYMHLREDE